MGSCGLEPSTRGTLLSSLGKRATHISHPGAAGDIPALVVGAVLCQQPEQGCRAPALGWPEHVECLLGAKRRNSSMPGVHSPVALEHLRLK